jgi:hypothetical protein
MSWGGTHEQQSKSLSSLSAKLSKEFEDSLQGDELRSGIHVHYIS